MSQAGKGDKYRPYDIDKFQRNYDRIFSQALDSQENSVTFKESDRTNNSPKEKHDVR